MLKKKVLSYTTLFEPAAEGGYVAYVPTLPGLVTQGESLEEAMEMARDAIEGYLAVLKEDGEKIPLEPDETVVMKVRAAAP